jgi:hypothetical protein
VGDTSLEKGLRKSWVFLLSSLAMPQNLWNVILDSSFHHLQFVWVYGVHDTR